MSKWKVRWNNGADVYGRPHTVRTDHFDGETEARKAFKGKPPVRSNEAELLPPNSCWPIEIRTSKGVRKA